jgi:hypothetical protein
MILEAMSGVADSDDATVKLQANADTGALLIDEQTLDLSTNPPVVAIGAASAQSSAVDATTKRIVLSASSACWVAIGADPTAAANTAGSFYLAAGAQSYPIKVTSGVTKIAVIQDSATGYLSIIESL